MNRKQLIVGFLALVSLGAIAGGTLVGNGGDYVRSTYMKIGESVLRVLAETDQGAAIVQQHGLNLDDLRATLTIEQLSVSPTPLRDNGGSLVDAIGQRGSVLLNNDAWVAHFERNRDVSFLVFHEMLRAAGVNDDNYVISGALNPFPREYRQPTLLKSKVELLPEDDLREALGEATLGGTGCPRDGRLIGEFDSEDNRFEFFPRDFTVASQRGRLDRRACNIAIPVKVPAGQRIVFTQVDLSAIAEMNAAAKATLGLEAFVPGQQGERQQKVIEGGEAGLKGRALLRVGNAFRTPCGRDTILRLNTSAMLEASEAGSSVDVERIAIYLQRESCE